VTSLVITIDTEPDNQWTMPVAGRPQPDLAFANTRGLGRLIDFFQKLDVKATWLTSWSVARDAESARLLRRAAASGDEIGGHLHAWETPPFTPADAQAHPYIYEYDAETRMAKLRNVTSAIADAFGAAPVSYRAGRWGIDDRERDNLAELGYTIDTSVVPGHSFATSRGLLRGGPDFRRHLKSEIDKPYRSGPLWEVPVSVTTIGLLPSLGAGGLAAYLGRTLSYGNGLVSRAAAKGLRETGLCRMVWIRPLVHPRSDLVRAAVSMARGGADVINIMFHSSEAFAGASPRSRTEENVSRLYDDLSGIVRALRDSGGVTPLTLRDAVVRHEPPPQR